MRDPYTPIDYTPALDVWAMAGAVLGHFEELDHLEECDIVYLFTKDDITIAKRRKVAFVTQPSAQGQCRKILSWSLRKLFGFEPDVIMVVDYYHWEELDNHSRMALVYHELFHIVHAETPQGKPRFDKMSGKPVFELQDHDVEEFTNVVEKFGDWNRASSALKIAEKREDTKVSDADLKKLVGEYEKNLLKLTGPDTPPLIRVDDAGA